jgi:replicative DNA helicase
MARSSVGKTAFLLNIIRHLSTKNSLVLFFSLEQPLAQVYERAVQISAQVEGEEVEKAYQREEPTTKNFSTAALKNYANVLIVEEDMLTYEELKQFIKVAEKKAGREVDIICIDYLGRMKGGRGSLYEITSELAKQFKHLAKEIDKAVIYLHQVSREGGRTGAEPLTMASGRDSGQVEEASDFVIGMWRPKINDPEYQKSVVEPLTVAVLKNRKGRCGKINLEFNKKTLTIHQEGEVPFIGIEATYSDEDLPF